ncbi:LOW QUALITY PROTEIN: dynein axonemal heavy chain 11 [Phoenicopterus ruber ruber]
MRDESLPLWAVPTNRLSFGSHDLVKLPHQQLGTQGISTTDQLSADCTIFTILLFKKMIKLLKAKESSYYPASRDVFKEVEDALVEAQDIDLRLRPLEKYIQLFWEMEFLKIRNLIPPLFHTTCLIWSHSKFYSMPTSIVVLLQEFCNLLIDQVASSKGSKPQIGGGLAGLSLNRRPLGAPGGVNLLSQLQAYSSIEVMSGYREIFINMLEFQKLEKPEFGGIKGKILSEQVCRMNEEFLESSEVFRKRTYDPSDYNNMLLTISGSFLKKPVIMEIFNPNCNILLEMFYQELGNCKHIRDECIKKRNPENSLLSVNFDPKLVAFLREVKYVLMLNQPSIPDSALATYEQRNSFAKCIGNLDLVVQLYNRLRQTTLEVECPRIEKELRTIDDQLKETEEICTWQATTCWDCIKQVKLSVCDSEPSKDNVRSVQGITNAWMEHAISFRKGKKEALLYLDDKGKRLAKIQKMLQEDCYQIHHLVEGNLKLFKADSSSASWKIYIEYVDDIVVNGLYNIIMSSLDFFLENTEESLKPALLFQAQMILDGTEIQFKPSLDEEAGDGFCDLIDIYENLYVQISKFEDSKIFESSFKVDMKPFKMNLLNIIKKWSWMFKEYLLRCVIISLTDFIKVTDAGLQREVTKGDYWVLVEITGHLLAVKQRQTTADEPFEPLKEMVALSESYGQKMPEVYAQLEELPEKWNAIKRAVLVKHKVTPLQASEVAVIRRKCTLLDANQELEMLEKEVLLMQESAKLFEVAVPDYKQMKPCQKELQLLKKVWDISVYINSSIDDWAKTQWRQINVEQMDVELGRFAKVRLLVAEDTTLTDLLGLQLHKVEDEVQSIVDNIVIELGTERILAEIDQTWAAMEFSYKEHHRNGAPLLKSDEQLLATLDNNQVQLQTILKSKYAAYFIEEVKGRQNKLNMADSVISIWMEVQRTRDLIELGADIGNTKNVMEATTKPKVYEKCEALQHRLSLCEKLNEYLETKHIAFPLFYFVSSADLLDVLSKGTQPNQVESWLQRLEEAVHKTVPLCIAEAILAYEEKRRQRWGFDYPARVALTGSQIWWVSDVEMAFGRLEEGLASAPRDCPKKQVTQLNALITVLLGELPLGDRQKIMTICTIDVHVRDVVESLVAQKVTSSQAFAWLSQLRHRRDDGQKHCFANICDAQFQYFYEYLGNTPRLVITPLTDSVSGLKKTMSGSIPSCYITLTQSLHLTTSGGPAGPPGTGKMETTKDLGCALGMMVYVVNCSEQMDYKVRWNIYKGLVQTGGWGCFDEFNRISVEVLSVVAVQVKTIHDAMRNKKKKFLFLDENITSKSSVGIFITMNPGYAGWTQLPENIKALFRPCAMVVPDVELICGITLVAGRLLARKFITLRAVCRQLLSKQDHYDWGLCAIKSVWVVAGFLKRGDKNRPEDQALMALRDFNLPKIVTDDIPIFMGLISDLFPALDVPRKRNLQFEQMAEQSTLELHLQPEGSFILKVVQLEELLAAHHSVCVIGNAGTGRSKMLKILHHTYVNLKQKPVWNDLTPKALTADELFGFIQRATRERKDSLLSSLLREQANITHEGPKWLVLDGDIDPMWIESLNTMDDNKGDEDQRTGEDTERQYDLSQQTGVWRWKQYVASWIETSRYQSEKANLTVLFDKYVPPYLEQLRIRFKTVTPIPENSMVQTHCSLLACLLTPENVSTDCPRELYEMYFVFACIWAFGGALSQDQAIFVHTSETACLKYFIDLLLTKGKPVILVGNAGVGKTVFVGDRLAALSEDYLLANIPLNHYTTSAVLQSKFHTDARNLSSLNGKGEKYYAVVTISLQLSATAIAWVLASPLRHKVENLAKLGQARRKEEDETVWEMLGKKLEKKDGHNYGPVGKKKLTYLIDDLNMPEVNRCGTVQPRALIWRHIDYGRWYDTQKLTIKEIHNCQYIACMNPTAGSFTINPRLQRHFAVFALNFPSSDSLTSIYSKILCFHFQQQAFTPSVIKDFPAIAQAAIWLHAVVQNFPPTAIKFHYIFNMRDLSHVFQVFFPPGKGALFATSECLQQPNDPQRLWLHESARVCGDKLVENKDCNFFYKMMMDTMHKYFESPLFYCPFANGSAGPCYKPVKGWEPPRNILAEIRETSSNEMHASMNLVLFEGAMQHVCRISGILEAPRGYALLIGVGGSGKQSLSRLAAYICSREVFQIAMKKDYRIQDLRVDLASLYIKPGAKNIPTVFLLTDAQVPDERFFVLINDLLASGEVPDPFNDEDAESIVTGVRKEVRALGVMDARERCWRFFLSRVRLQLKTVPCFSPAGAALRARARKFPAVANRAAIAGCRERPREALRSVGGRLVQEAEGVGPLIQDSICDLMAYAHTSVNMLSAKYNHHERRYNYTTPKSFLEQITLSKILLEKKSKEMLGHMGHLVNGMQKLKAAAFQVEDLKSKLASQEAELQLRNGDAEALIAKIGLQTEKASQEKAIADAEEQKVTAIQGEVYLRQKECEDDLLKAEHALVAATAALDMLNKVNLMELKAFTSPSMAVTNVSAAVMVLLPYKGKVPKDGSGKAAKVFMGKVDDFLQALSSYDKEQIPQNCLKVAKEHYLKDPDFNPNYVRTKSFAAAGLCAWVISIVKFIKVYCEVEPKHRALAQANAELAAATEKLEASRKKLLVLDNNLRKLTASLKKAVAEKVRCRDDVNRANKTIELANRLVRGLEAENMHWCQSIENLKAQNKTLRGDVLLTAAFMSYSGPFTNRYHQELREHFWIPFLKSQKVPVPGTEGLDPIATLTDDATIAAWSNEGLPGDRMSTEYATVLTNGECWPLMIDPQQQGIKCIKNKYGADLKVIHLGQKGFLKTIEALAYGETLLIENTGESVDPILDPLLGRHTVKKGKCIKIENKECEFNKDFCLILHTKLANPRYKPELQAQTTLINFTVTRDRLEEQLLAEVDSAERPDLEKRKSVLAKQQNHSKTELRQLEDDMLLSLSAAQGNYDDSELVEKLELTKSTAAEIQRKASNEVFQKAIKQAENAGDIRCLISNLTEAVTYSTFIFKSQGLFKKDKLIFLAQTAFQILLRSREIELLELDFLLRFRVEHAYKSPVDFLTTQSWSAIRAMAVTDVFRGLGKDIERSTNRWKKWVDSECSEKEKLPQEWTNKSSPRKLIILRALCPDRMTYALSPAAPVFFILSPGVDPLEDIETLGKKLGFTIDSGRFYSISSGQGQEMVAEEALEKAARHGHWVLLQDIHLVAKWLGTLEKLLKQYSEESHPDFCGFISAEPGSAPEEHVVPQGILENSIKITSEPPTGMLANLHAALYSFDQDTLEPCTREGNLKASFFSLCYFHTCIAGRLKFGPQGWNGRYRFSARDLAVCVRVLCNYLETHRKVPWEDLHCLFGLIMYGGHITDAWDRRLCCIYLQEFISPPLLEGQLTLARGFLAPPNLDYAGYHKYIDEMLPSESPALYGLHPNAEVGYLTATSDNLFKTLEMQPMNSSVREGSGQSAEEKVKNVLDNILEMLPEEFNMAEIMQKDYCLEPYALVCLQERERMNLLLSELCRSLKLDFGLKGELMFSPHMEALQSALFCDAAPDAWTKLAYPSTYSLAHWVTSLLMRYGELETWTQDRVLPAVVWLSGLFNPQSFLTVVATVGDEKSSAVH